MNSEDSSVQEVWGNNYFVNMMINSGRDAHHTGG